MALMEQWKDYASSFAQNQQQYERFWNQYFALEKGIYEKLLEEKEAVKGTVKDLAVKYGVDIKVMTGFLDGINDSLKEPNPVDTM